MPEGARVIPALELATATTEKVRLRYQHWSWHGDDREVAMTAMERKGDDREARSSDELEQAMTETKRFAPQALIRQGRQCDFASCPGRHRKGQHGSPRCRSVHVVIGSTTARAFVVVNPAGRARPRRMAGGR